MKFKTKEELYDKSVDKHGYLTRDVELQNDVVDVIFESFAKRVNHYRKQSIKTVGSWNESLFEHCFGDVK